MLNIRNVFCLSLAIVLGGCEQQAAPDFHTQQWGAFRVDFCTETSEMEFWETRDKDKLSLLQGAFVAEAPKLLDRVVQSPNHRLFVVLSPAGEAGASTTWQITLKRDQAHVTFFNTADPTASYQANTDPMFYRALNTLLHSHMNESLDIFRKCELGGAR